VGENYAFRDYFHGQGRDLDQEDAARTAEPIRFAHRSIVFRSQVTERNMVAFSVPVRAADDADEVVGVLGMTVELGRFGVLELDSAGSQLTALVDTRRDGSGQRGLVLQHTQLAKAQAALRSREGVELPSYYLPPPRVDQFQALGASRVRQLRATPGGVVPGPRVEADYVDPVGGDFGGFWLAAFEPVVVRDNDTGWVVIAQERDAPE
jgi:hypothetical protein